MRTVTFHSTGDDHTTVPAMGFGCMGLSWAYIDNTVTRGDKIDILRSAADLGVKLFDTSDQYGPFTNEELVGEALATRRNDIFLSTKGGLVVDPVSRQTSCDGTPEHLHRALQDSLDRLRTDHVDLYFLHRVDPATPVERSWEALAREAEAGHTRYLGLSEASVDQIERCNRIHPVSSVQTELSLFSRGALDDVVPYCLEHDIVFIAYAPLSRGLLPGQITSDTDLDPNDMRRGSQRLSTPVMSANTESIIDPIRQYADELGLTASQVALAWVLAQGDNIAAIPGTQHLNHLEENMQAAFVTLTKEWLAHLDNLPQAAGARY